jgi:AraC-like DNA-binding protein
MKRRLEKISTKIWYAHDLGPAELLRGRFADYSYDVHTHDKACFALFTRGAIRIRMRGSEFVARAGDLYAIDADEPHAGWPIDNVGWSLRTLYVDLGYLRALLDDDSSGRTPALAGPIIRDPDLASLFRGVHYCSEISGPSLKREESYLNFVTRLFERHVRYCHAAKAPGWEDRHIRLARDFLDHHLDEKVRLVDIANAAELPPFRLFRSFERATGMSPHTYQRQARIRFAAGLIRLGHALGDVAAASGFADQASTIAPAGTLSNTVGARSAKEVAATQPGAWVSDHAVQPTANFCRKPPVSERVVAAAKIHSARPSRGAPLHCGCASMSPLTEKS